MIATALLLAAAGALAPPTGEAPPRIRAIVIGNNVALDDSLPRLRFADDDAVRWWHFLRAFSDDVTLLSVLDEETRGTHEDAAEAALPPLRRELDHALTAVFERLRQDAEDGRRSQFYFVFSGHGTISSGQAQLHLADAAFTKGDLEAQVFARSPATWNHLVIDACNSFLLIDAKGDKIADPLRRHYKRLALPANTGVLLSTVEAADSHEYELFRAGVFTHEVLSAVTGAADASGDGRITYDEIGGFFAAANQGIEVPRYRPKFWARGPLAPGTAPFVDLAWGRFSALLRIEQGEGARFWLEDSRGVRYADLFSAPDHAHDVALLDREFYFLRGDRREARLAWPKGDAPVRLGLASLAFVPSGAQTRGSAEEAYRAQLFAVPFGPGYQRQFKALSWRDEGTALGPRDDVLADLPAAVLPPPGLPTRPWKWVTGGLAAASLAGSAGAWWAARSNAGTLARTPSTTPDADIARIGLQSDAASALLVTGVALSALCAAVFVADF